MTDKSALKGLLRWLPPRGPEDHKGRFGHVLLLAGSRGMAGAAVLACRSALRAGAGLVTAAVPESQQAAVAGQVPEAMTLGLPETGSGSLRPEAVSRIRGAHLLRSFSVLALGPGLSTHPETARAVVGVLGSLAIPAVIDADALNILSAQPRADVRTLLERRGAPWVFTPHPGELARLLAVETAAILSDRKASARSLVKELGGVCLLKGHRTVVTDGKSLWVNPTGNPGLAKGGSGDALTGIIAGLWAQHAAAGGAEGGYEAAALGAFLHGLAADMAVKTLGERSLLASDVIEALPQAFLKLGL